MTREAEPFANRAQEAISKLPAAEPALGSRPAHRPRRRRLGVLLVVLAGVAAVAFLGAVRYRPLVQDAMALRDDLRSIARRVTDAGANLDATTLAAIRRDADTIVARHARVAAALQGDPLIGIARVIPGLDRQVRAADDLVDAAGLLLGVMGDGLDLGSRFLEVRDHRGGTSTIEGLVGLAAASREKLTTARAAVDRALAMLNRIPDDSLGPIRGARDEARAQLGRYRPLLGDAVEAAQFVPSFLGWDSPKRYLVLAQDPAELRPTGGYIGQFGIVVFDRGRITEMTFRDIATIYTQPPPPFVAGPAPLRDHLLGPRQSWRLADANWSPDFPTAARQAEAFYRSEANSVPIDGVIGLTTYAIDDLLAVTGPLNLPGFDLTVKAGSATFDILAATREPRVAGADRKAVLGPFAKQLVGALYALPARQWLDIPQTLERIRAEHHAAIWMRDPGLQAALATAAWAGALPVPAGDELMIVEANVGPVSKLHLVTERKIDLTVTLDAAGNAHGQLTLGYNNHISDATADDEIRKEAAFLRAYQNRDHLGVYLRFLVPRNAQVGELTLDAGKPTVGGLEAVDEELGRRAFGAYAMIPPGKATLELGWVTPNVVERLKDGRSRYRLTMPKPGGRLADPLRIAIELPPGTHVVTTSDSTLNVANKGGVATVTHEGPFRSDTTIDVEYQ